MFDEKKVRIQFLIRCDCYTKRGGDIHQIEMYKKHLERMGTNVSISNDLSVADDFDVYIIVNIDRPIETLVYYNKLKEKGLLKKTLLLPIHHSLIHITDFEKRRKDFLGVILKIFNDFYSKEKIKNYLRSVKTSNLLRYAFSHTFLDYKKNITNILNNVGGVIFIAEGEKSNVEADFSLNQSNIYYVKNGVSLVNDNNRESHEHIKDIDILVCGRIEPRKNSLEIARVLANKRYSVVFVGALNHNARGYCRKFIQLVDESKNIKYMNAVHHDAISNIFRRTRIHLSASNFEVASLVDLEAYAYGCHVISSTCGNTVDYLGERAMYVYPTNLENMLPIIETIIKKNNDAVKQYDFMEQNFSWEISAKKLLDIIKEFNLKNINL